MSRPSLRWSLIAVAATLLPLRAGAQTLPPPPPPGDGALRCPACEPSDDERRAIDEATELLATGRADAARRVLQPRLAGQSPWGRSYTPLAVLDRLATRLADRPLAAADAGATDDGTHQPRVGVEAVSLYASAITLGVGTGIWLDVMFDVDDIRPAVSIPLVFGAAAAGALYLAERSGGPVRRGRGTAMSNGFLLGVVGGALLGGYGGGTLRWSDRAVASTVWGGAVLGTGLGFGLSSLADSGPASAALVGSGGLWGAALGLGIGLMADVDGDGVLVAGMVGEVVGTGTAAALAAALRPSEAQVRWMDLGVVSGGLVGFGLAVLFFADASGRSLTGPSLVVEAGMVGGGVLGYVLGRPSTGAAARPTAARDRLAMSPSIAPTAGGAQLLLSLPNLL